MEFHPVPAVGPLTIGTVYRRQHLNDRFGGNRMSGIVSSPVEPVVLLFHTAGDMTWSHASTGHCQLSRGHVSHDLFERVQRKDGLWRLVHVMHCVGYRTEPRPDRTGATRQAIVFGLVPVEGAATLPSRETTHDARRRMDELKAQLGEDGGDDGDTAGTMRHRVQNVYYRSALVVEYALLRANGVCEACGNPAPFVTKDDRPFLEVHHIDRLADGGPDRFDRVAAVCPNCHRRCHYSIDGAEYNAALRQAILTKEGA